MGYKLFLILMLWAKKAKAALFFIYHQVSRHKMFFKKVHPFSSQTEYSTRFFPDSPPTISLWPRQTEYSTWIYKERLVQFNTSTLSWIIQHSHRRFCVGKTGTMVGEPGPEWDRAGQNRKYFRGYLTYNRPANSCLNSVSCVFETCL